LIAVVPERLVQAYASVLNLVIKKVPLEVGTFDEDLLHSARTHADIGCSWPCELIKSLYSGDAASAAERVRHAHQLKRLA
jgi:hypothetical protein